MTQVRRIVVGTLVLLIAVSWGAGTALAQHEGHEHGKPSEAKPEPVAKEKETKTALPKCPISGEAANLYVSTMTDDGPVYFCCPDCIGKFKANPKDFTDKVAAQRAALRKTPRIQVNCPVSGKAVNKKIFIEQGSQKIYFNSEESKAKYEKNPTEFKASLANCYTYQRKCPVMGGDIDPTAYTELPNKQRVYFCCMDCEPKLLANPDKYAPKLAAQGYPLDVEQVKKTGKPGEKKEKP